MSWFENCLLWDQITLIMPSWLQLMLKKALQVSYTSGSIYFSAFFSFYSIKIKCVIPARLPECLYTMLSNYTLEPLSIFTLLFNIQQASPSHYAVVTEAWLSFTPGILSWRKCGCTGDVIFTSANHLWGVKEGGPCLDGWAVQPDNARRGCVKRQTVFVTVFSQLRS